MQINFSPFITSQKTEDVISYNSVYIKTCLATIQCHSPFWTSITSLTCSTSCILQRLTPFPNIPCTNTSLHRRNVVLLPSYHGLHGSLRYGSLYSTVSHHPSLPKYHHAILLDRCAIQRLGHLSCIYSNSITWSGGPLFRTVLYGPIHIQLVSYARCQKQSRLKIVNI